MGMVTRNGVLEMIVVELSILVVDAIYDGCGMAEVGVGSKNIINVSIIYIYIYKSKIKKKKNLSTLYFIR